MVHKYSYHNGIQLFVVEDHSSKTLAYQTWFKVGSIDESIKKTGLAHLFEHMMFKGTKKYPAGSFDSILAEIGGNGTNAFTSHDYTGFITSIPSNQIETLMELESDRMHNLEITEDKLKSEIDVVKNERRLRVENSPEGILQEKLYELAFKTHPYRWPVIGYMNDLSNITVKDCYEFYRNHYAPNNAAIIIVGDIDHEHASKLVAKYYSSIPAHTTTYYSNKPEAPQDRERSKSIPLNLHAENVYIGYRIPAQTNPDFAILEMIANSYFNSNSSSFYKNLIESKIASSVSANTTSSRNENLFVIEAKLQKGKSYQDFINRFDSEVRRIQNTGFNSEQLQMTKKMAEYEQIRGLVSKYMIARVIGSSFVMNGNFDTENRNWNIFKQSQPEQLKTVFKKYFSRSNRTIISSKRKN